MQLTCAISPDADDLFMFKAILDGAVDTEGLDFRVTTRDTDLLNRMADGDGPDVTAISIAHYPRVAARYRLFNHGGSVGRGYGPVVVARSERPIAGRIGVPGLTTTAYAVLRMAVPDFEPVVIPITPPSRSFAALADGEVDAMLLIHEGRLTFADEGCVALLDIGEWWGRETGLPLPLGGNVVRRDLEPDVLAAADRVIRASIAHALAHREPAIDWLLGRGGPLGTREAVDRYLGMYANADTLDYGDDGRAAIRLLLARGAAAGLWEAVGDVDFV